VSTQLIRPLNAERLEIRCNVGDAIVANLAVHIVFFFERHLDTRALTRAFAHALTNLPIFAGRMAVDNGRMRIRCEGQGVPFTSVSSGRTLPDAIRSASQDSGGWAHRPGERCHSSVGMGPVVQGTCHAARGRRNRGRFLVTPRDRRHADVDALHERVDRRRCRQATR
jgi:hypothetical protein